MYHGSSTVKGTPKARQTGNGRVAVRPVGIRRLIGTGVVRNLWRHHAEEGLGGPACRCRSLVSET